MLKYMVLACSGQYSIDTAVLAFARSLADSCLLLENGRQLQAPLTTLQDSVRLGKSPQFCPQFISISFRFRLCFREGVVTGV